jgi:putative endonuclease
MVPWLRRILGHSGERAAERYLIGQGFRILERGLRSPLGELDLIALDGRQIVFVEVKSRANLDAGHPAEAVDLSKQHKLTTLALAYLKKHGLLEHSARFDVVAIIWPEESKQPRIEHFRNAFEPPTRFQMFS